MADRAGERCRCDGRAGAGTRPYEVGSASRSVGRPSVETSRRTGDSVESLARREDFEAGSGAMSACQISMGNGASNMEGGIIALNCTTAAFVLNSGQAYFVLQCLHRSETTARTM